MCVGGGEGTFKIIGSSSKFEKTYRVCNTQGDKLQEFKLGNNNGIVWNSCVKFDKY